MAKILVLTVKHFNRNELWPELKVFTDRGHDFVVVSTSKIIFEEKTTNANSVHEVLSEETTLDGYDAFTIVSGKHADTEAFWHNPIVASLALQAKKENKPIGAICAAVPAIRSICKDVRVSAFPLKAAVLLLEEAGAKVSKASVSTDGNIVTGENEITSTMVATNLCDLIEGKPLTYVLEPSTFKRKLKERKPMPILVRLQEIEDKTGKRGFDEV